MRPSKRASAGAIAGAGFALAGFVLFDAYEDWVIQGDPIWTALFENSLPLLIVGILPYAAWRLYRSDQGHDYAFAMSKWTLAGVFTMLLLASWVVGIQLLQNKLKPEMLVVQTTTVGAVAGLLVGYNTAELDEARAKNSRQKRRFESLFANSPSAIVALIFEDGEPIIDRTNDSFDELFNFASGDVVGRPLFEVIPPESRETRDAIVAHVDRGEVYTTETDQFTTAGGKHFKLRVVPYGVEHTRAYAVYQDVTELKETQRELEGTVDQLEASNEQLQQFAYVASHDLQEPLRMVSSYVDLLESEYGDQLDGEADEYMQFAVDGAERMQAMIDDLLQYSRVRTQGQEFTEIDAEAVLETTLTDLQLLIEEASASVTYDDLPAIEADENQLGQLFQNLLKNAIEHTVDHTDRTPEIHVGAEGDEDGRAVVFSVADNGPGIPEDQQERVFEIFEQGGRNDDGTGIGLAVCQRIVNRHGGDIWVENNDSEGAVFCFTMPTAPNGESTPPEPQLQ